MPTKRMGRLEKKEGKWSFTYRKFFLFKKTITIIKTESVLIKGFLYSKISQQNKQLCSLPPRYQKDVEQVQAYLGIEKLLDSKLKRGLKAIIAWVKNLFTRTDTAPETA
jgi:hypothetical protein